MFLYFSQTFQDQAEAKSPCKMRETVNRVMIYIDLLVEVVFGGTVNPGIKTVSLSKYCVAVMIRVLKFTK